MTKNILSKLEVKPVRWIEEVLELALTEMPEPLKEEATDENRQNANKAAGKSALTSKNKKSESRLRH